VQQLAKLAMMATLPNIEALPWCGEPGRDFLPSSSSITTGGAVGKFVTLWGWVRQGDSIYSLYDCEELWPQNGWGPVRTGSANKPQRAATGEAVFDQLSISWADVALRTSKFATSLCSGTGFAGYFCLNHIAVNAAIDTISKSTVTIFNAQLNSDLARMDLTVTLPGAFIALSLSIVALVAGYVARGELLHCFMRCGLNMSWAKFATLIVMFFALITYPATVVIAEVAARQDNPDGSTSTVRWVQVTAGGADAYRVVGAISVAATGEYNTAAFVIVWLTLALSLVLTTIICVTMLRFTLNNVREYGELPALAAASPSEVEQLRGKHALQADTASSSKITIMGHEESEAGSMKSAGCMAELESEERVKDAPVG
jgi:hypothetical protein